LGRHKKSVEAFGLVPDALAAVLKYIAVDAIANKLAAVVALFDTKSPCLLGLR
jgi:hypothetical protein